MFVIYCMFILMQLILDNLKMFNQDICSDKPLFQVETLLAAPDVVLHPGANDVYKLTLTCVRDCIEGFVNKLLFVSISIFKVQNYLNMSVM